MRARTVFATLLLIGPLPAVAAQEPATAGPSCTNMSGLALLTCQKEQKKAAKAAQSGTAGVTASDAKTYNETAAAANAKTAAKDYAGAAAAYQAAIAASAKSPLLPRYKAGLAVAYRQEAVANYNNAPQPTYPPAGATNDQIRAANAANRELQRQRIADALPLFKRAQVAAADAAAAAAAGKDRSIDDVIALELRQDASFLYRFDQAGVFATPRPGIEFEAKSLRDWLAKNPTVADATVAQFGIATAAALTAKDPAAGVALADEVFARSANDPDGVLGYAEILVAAKVPAGDPRRAKALAALGRIEPTVAEDAKRASVTRLKAALSAG